MILFLYGPDTFRSRDQLHKMMEKFRLERDPDGLNLVRLDATKETAGQILEQILALPFLAERRMVVVENLLESKHEELQEEMLRRIEEQRLSPANVLIFWEATDTFKKKNAKTLFGRLAEEKYAQKFDLLSGAKLEGWIAAEVKNRGGNIHHTAVGYIVDNIGSDMWQLNSLLDELVAFTAHTDGPKEITRGEVELFLDKKGDDNIFNLVDAIVGKQSKKVFALLQEQYRLGAEVTYLFAMVLRQFRILLEMKDLLIREDRILSEVMAKRLGVHPFVVKKSLPLVNKYSFGELKNIYTNLLDLDKKIKTGQGDQQILFDAFVGKLSYE